jgi:hypothetical protein
VKVDVPPEQMFVRRLKEGTAMTTVSITPVTSGQKKSIVRLVEEVGENSLNELSLTKDDAQRLLGKGGEFKSRLHKLLSPLIQEFSVAPNIVIVPDLAAVDLTALTKRDLKLTYTDGDYERWNYYTDLKGQPIAGRGLTFEASIWKPELKPDETIGSDVVRAYFRDHGGFYGHTGAFTQWRRQNPSLQGHHASILEDNVCWRRSRGRLYVPGSDFDGGDRRLNRYWIDGDWPVHWSFVAFREVS